MFPIYKFQNTQDFRKAILSNAHEKQQGGKLTDLHCTLYMTLIYNGTDHIFTRHPHNYKAME